MNLCGVNIDDGRTHVVAEIGNAHNGSLKRALQLIQSAKDAGASFVKFQCYTPDELVALRGDGPAPAQWGEQGWSMRALYEKAQTASWYFPTLFNFAREIGIAPFSSVFGLESLALLESCGCEAYKVARLDNQHAWLIGACKATGKPVVVSSDTESQESWQTRDALRFLYCPPSYPQVEFGLSYERFHDMSDCYHAPRQFSGFSYHGTSIEPCVMAATLGAKLIEVHVQIDDEPSELEQNISLSISQVSALVQRVRDVERWRA